MSVYRRKEEVLALTWREKAGRAPVSVISTSSRAGSVNVNGKQKPCAIDLYNRFMGGVDLHDAMLYSYLDERKTVKVWKKCVFNILGRILLNAYIVYSSNTAHDPKLSRKDFVCSVINDLAHDWLAEKAIGEPQRRAPRNPLVPIHLQADRVVPGVRTLDGRKEKNCCVCSRLADGIRHRSRTVCVVCGHGLHAKCAAHHVCNEN